MIHRRPSATRQLAESIRSAINERIEGPPIERDNLTMGQIGQLLDLFSKPQEPFKIVVSRHVADRIRFTPTDDQWRRFLKRRVRKKARRKL